MPKPFKAMTQQDARTECSVKESLEFARCGKCKHKVALHCYSCKIQITGCICTEIDRFGEDEAWQRSVATFGEELARRRYHAAGMWVPHQ